MTTDPTHEDLAEILALLERSPFDEIRIEWKGLRIALARNGARLADSAAGAMDDRPEQPPAASARIAPSGTPLVPAPTAVAPGPALTGRPLHAPFLGTFYRSPEPGRPPFVENGSHVEVGDTLCLLEVMKMFNAIKAEHAGCIELIAPADGALVESGALLFSIIPD